MEVNERDAIVKRGKQGFRPVFPWNVFLWTVYRWMSDPPSRDDTDAVLVDWLSIEIIARKGKVTDRNGFVTDLAADRGTAMDKISKREPTTPARERARANTA